MYSITAWLILNQNANDTQKSIKSWQSKKSIFNPITSYTITSRGKKAQNLKINMGARLEILQASSRFSIALLI